MTDYAWGKKLIPYPILEETDDLIILDINGASTVMPVDRVVGRLSDGDQVQVLTVGGCWTPAVVSGYDRWLEVKIEPSGRLHKLNTVMNLRRLERNESNCTSRDSSH